MQTFVNFNPLNPIFTKWSNTLKQFVGNIVCFLDIFIQILCYTFTLSISFILYLYTVMLSIFGVSIIIYQSTFRQKFQINIILRNRPPDAFLGKRCSSVNLFHIFRTPFPKNTSGGLLCILKLISPTIRIWVIILVVLCFQLIYKILAILVWMRISKREKCLGIFRDVSKYMCKWETEISFHHLNNEKSFE